MGRYNPGMAQEDRDGPCPGVFLDLVILVLVLLGGERVAHS